MKTNIYILLILLFTVSFANAQSGSAVLNRKRKVSNITLVFQGINKAARV